MDLPNRKANRLPDFDYSIPGAYFVTICTKNRKNTLCKIVGNILGWFKYQVTREINSYCHTAGIRFFQRSYHDHVVRGEQDYLKIWQYIDNNPAQWKDDCFYRESLE